MNQTTLKNEAVLEGVGLHTGNKTRLSLKPAAPDTGVVFILDGKKIPALVSRVSNTSRNTSLSENGVTVHTVEHVLAALHGMGVDNAIVEMDSAEPPAMDGSALPFAEAIKAAGVDKTDAPAKTVNVRGQVMLGDNGSFVLCLPSDVFQATYILEYDHPMAARQGFTFSMADGPGAFIKEIAPARTFGFIEEVEALKKAGLALGGGGENAVVVYPDSYSSDLRFREEFARHKLLDMMGDARLLGAARPAFHIIGVRSGHALNAVAMKEIMKQSE